MALYRRGRVWWLRYRSVRESTGTDDRRRAEEYEARRIAELWRADALGESAGPTLAESIAAWVEDHARHKRSYADDWLRITVMTPLLPDVRVRDVTTATLADIRRAVIASRKRPIGPATANRYLAILSAALHHAHERGHLAAVPSIPYLAEPEGRIDFLAPAQAVALIDEAPKHLARMIRFSLATGLRDANMRLLTWDRVNLGTRVAWVNPEDAKAGRALSIPLNDDAIAVLQECLGEHETHVFTYPKPLPPSADGERRWRRVPMTQGANNTAFKKAKARAGVAHITWHTLRHTWASWHVQRGTPLPVLQILGGWSSLDMVLRYAHLAPSHAAAWAGNSGTISAQRPMSSGENTPQVLDSVGWPMGLEPTTAGITILRNERKPLKTKKSA